MALTLPRVMTPWEWIGIVMARGDTQCRTSAGGRSAVIRCSGPHWSGRQERAHELRSGFGRWGILNGPFKYVPRMADLICDRLSSWFSSVPRPAYEPILAMPGIGSSESTPVARRRKQAT
jgi:hypothetical protein